MKGNRFLMLFVSFAVLLILSACSSSGKNSAVSARRASVMIKAGFKTAGQSAKPRSTAIIGTVSEVKDVTVDVQDGSGSFIITDVHLANNNGTWTAPINDVPAGEQLTFRGHASNGGLEIFTGVATQTLTGTNDQVTIVMSPVSDNTAMHFLNVTQISRPALIGASATVPISITVTGNTNENVYYTLTSQAGGGGFDAATGMWTIGNSGTYTFVLFYTAPASAGSFTHDLEVTDSRGNSVETSFTTKVATQLASTETMVQFNPVITAVVPVRNGSDVTFTAQVSDSGVPGQLTYAWSFDGGLAFADSTVNPAVLQGYTEELSGTLALTVANSVGGTTTLYYAINPNQFPASVVTDLMYLPHTPNSTGVNACGDTSVSGNIIMISQDEGGAGADLNGDGDTGDCVLGYFDVAAQALVNTGIPAEFASVGGDVIAFLNSETGTLGYYSISANTWTDTEIALENFSNNDSNHFVSNGRIAFVASLRDLTGDGAADRELCIYFTSTDTYSMTGVQTPAQEWEFNPNISGDIVVFRNTDGNIGYHNVVTGLTNDTGIPGSEPAIDSGIIVFNADAGYVAYYVIATQEYVLTPLPADGNPMPSISDGIIAISADEGAFGGDLNGDGDAWDPVAVLYDIPSGRIVNTGLVKYHWGEIANGIIEYRGNEDDYGIDFTGDGDTDDVVHLYSYMSDATRLYFGR